jgi:2-oxoglutarate ferredoxin oxidoreductase subunit alpha
VGRREGAELGIVSIGGCDAAVREATDRLAEAGLPLDCLRVRGFPFGPEVAEFLDAHERVFVVEQNRDGQLLSLLANETGFPRSRLVSVRYYGGLPLSAHHVIDGINAWLEAAGRGAVHGAAGARGDGASGSNRTSVPGGRRGATRRAGARPTGVDE